MEQNMEKKNPGIMEEVAVGKTRWGVKKMKQNKMMLDVIGKDITEKNCHKGKTIAKDWINCRRRTIRHSKKYWIIFYP